MRHFITCAALLLLPPAFIQAQEPKFTVKIDQVRVGFRAYGNDDVGQFKVGMWSPVYVDVTAGPKAVRATEPDKSPILEFESTDSEGVGTFYRLPIALDANETRTFMGYARSGNIDAGSKIGVKLKWDGKTFEPRGTQRGAPLMDLTAHVYLSLGARLPDMRDTLVVLAKIPNQPNQDLDNRDTGLRHAVFENDAARLPEHWFGYEGVDFLFLSTDKKFLEDLLRESNQPRVKAIAQWVRHGGRLVVPVKHATQDLLARLLQGPAWQPPVPVVPPSSNVAEAPVKKLVSVQEFARTNKPFPGPGESAVTIAKLDPGQVLPGAWDVAAKTDDGRPLITRMPYGRGNIMYLAFSLDEAPFTRWDGRVEFLKTLIEKYAPAVNNRGGQNQNNVQGNQADIATDLQRHLDNFDISVVPFGYVALFIILYILVVGPLDYFVLKHVFHKLEWTWITFPAVVIAVSVVAYFTAYALKGNDLRINKIDIVDFDLRTDLDEQGRTARAYAYGQTYFTILSPRIQNYTVGIEPNPAFWGGMANEKSPLSAEPVTWFGRPEFDGPGAYGRSGSQGFFRRPYSYAEDAKGLIGVPIPVWTSKSFSASWEAALPKKGPFVADLVYHTREFQGKNVKLSGTIQNNLPVDLEDVWVFFGKSVYQIPGGLPSSVKGAPPTKVYLQLSEGKEKERFTDANEARMKQRNEDFHSGQGSYDPTNLVRQAMFFERLRTNAEARDHSMRFVDFSWRVPENDPGQLDTGLRESILYAQVAFQRGQAENIQRGPVPPPTKLWLGALPTEGKARPEIAGTLAQDTYIRVVMPVRLAPNN